MKDKDKRKEELINELVRLRRRVAELEKSKIQRKRTKEALQESEEKYRTVFETTETATVIIEEDTIMSLVNREFEKLSGYSKEEVEGKKSWTEFVVKDDLERMKEYHRLRRIKSNVAPRNYEFQFIDRQGNVRDIFLTVAIIPGTKKSVASLSDITEHKKAEEKIKRLYSLQMVTRNINQVLLRAESEPQLFQQICDLLMKIKNFKFVWVGLLQEGSFEIKPITQAGFEKGYLSAIKVRWDDSEYGEGPTGIAIKTKRPFIMRDIEDNPRYAPWRREALKRGYSSSIALPLIHKDEVIGVLNIYSQEKDAFKKEEVRFLDEVARDITNGIKTLRLEKDLKRSVKQLKKTTEGIINTIAKIVEIKDPYTAGHQRRVAQLAVAIAMEIGLSKKQIQGLRMAGVIHDIGKIYVPAEILSKPGKLTKIEYSMLKIHPQYGYDMLKDIEFPWPVALAILQHHERLDGSGYPQGLKGNNILLEARILGVADVVEAMSSYRPYRPALGIDKALEEISHNKGKLYDSRIVDVCLKLFREKGYKFR